MLVAITSTNLDKDILFKKCEVGLEHTPCDTEPSHFALQQILSQ